MSFLFTAEQFALAEAARVELLSWLLSDSGWLRCYDLDQLKRLSGLVGHLHGELEKLLTIAEYQSLHRRADAAAHSGVQVHEDDGEV